MVAIYWFPHFLFRGHSPLQKIKKNLQLVGRFPNPVETSFSNIIVPLNIPFKKETETHFPTTPVIDVCGPRCSRSWKPPKLGRPHQPKWGLKLSNLFFIRRIQPTVMGIDGNGIALGWIQKSPRNFGNRLLEPSHHLGMGQSPGPWFLPSQICGQNGCLIFQDGS